MKTVLAVAAVIGVCASANAAPLIGDVLTCGQAGQAGGLAPGTEMQRVDIDLAVFPDALCNDGTGAVMYFRPFSDAGDRNRWVIQLQGGGGCGSGDACAKRWCMIDTNFSMTQMTSSVAPTSGIDGKGIMDRRPLNPIGSWNQVFIRYCSSDSWSGASADVDLQADLGGGPIAYRIHFLGSRILDAAIDTLRRNGVGALVHTQGGVPVTLPDLDEAEAVIVAGASAGGQGVIHNVDRLAELLQANNVGCGGGGCPLEVMALIDSVFAPSLEGLDFSQSVPCGTNGLCDWESVLLARNTAFVPLGDSSCQVWHQTNLPGTEWQCEDRGHVVRHHVTTPMFIRMGQEDALQSAGYIDSRYAIPGQGPMDLAGFAGLVRTELADLANIQSTAHEGAGITTVPGVFGPTCPEHETLRNNPQIFSAVIEVNGTSYAMFDVMGNWLAGTNPSVAITSPGGVEFCPGAEVVPALSEAGLVLLGVGLVGVGAVCIRRRREV